MAGRYRGPYDVQGRRHGEEGTFYYSSSFGAKGKGEAGGFVYTGAWRQGVKHGHGRLQFPNGGLYEGSFVNGEIEGKGMKRWPTGASYHGEFYAGELNGQGTFFDPTTGEEYEGWWVNNQRCGPGRHRDCRGDLYVGSFESNHRTGKGRLVTVAGLTYQGSFKRDHFEGHGTMSYGDEGLYEGQWHESRRHGQGRYTDQSTGLCYEGPWVLDSPTEKAEKLEVDLPELTARKAAALEVASHQPSKNKPRASRYSKEPILAFPSLPAGSALGPIQLRLTRASPEANNSPPPPQPGTSTAPAPPGNPSIPLAPPPPPSILSESESGRLLTVTLHKQQTDDGPGPTLPFLRRLPQLSSALHAPDRFPPPETRVFYSATGQELDPLRAPVNQEQDLSWLAVQAGDQLSWPPEVSLPSGEQQDWAICLDFRVGGMEEQGEGGGEGPIKENEEVVVRLAAVEEPCGSRYSVDLLVQRAAGSGPGGSAWVVFRGRIVCEVGVGRWHSLALLSQPAPAAAGGGGGALLLSLAVDGQVYEADPTTPHGLPVAGSLTLDPHLLRVGPKPPSWVSFTAEVLNVGVFAPLPSGWSWASYTDRAQRWYQAVWEAEQEQRGELMPPPTDRRSIVTTASTTPGPPPPGTRLLEKAQLRIHRGQASLADLVLPQDLAPGLYSLRISDHRILVPPDDGPAAAYADATLSTRNQVDRIFPQLGPASYTFSVTA